MKMKHLLSIRTIIAILTLLIILGGVLLGSSWSDARRSQASADHTIYKYYTTVTIEDGDTLWTLADAYMDDQYQNKREFIAEVKQLNQIDENRIHEGTQLVIPYYSAEYL